MSSLVAAASSQPASFRPLEISFPFRLSRLTARAESLLIARSLLPRPAAYLLPVRRLTALRICDNEASDSACRLLAFFFDNARP
jgi:hypothetical protein